VLPLTLAEVAAACGGRLAGGVPDRLVRGVAIDSRRVQPGDLFVGLRGERHDGDSFAAAALAAGAAAVVVREATAAALPAGAAAVVVDDGLAALQRLAAAVRRRLDVKVVGITGSVGKTSTKDILASLLRPLVPVAATAGNQNNEVGLPLTLLAADAGTRVVVAEMAMRGRGQIRELARLAAPDVGVVTAVAPVHLELVDTVEDVAAAKAELLEELAGGTAVVPCDEPLLAPHLARFRGRVVTFGGPGADVAVVGSERRGERTRLLVDAFGQRTTLDLNLTGAHYVRDALAALAAFVALGFRPDQARAGAAAVALSGLRGEVRPLADGGLLLNDAYNANPVATCAAVDHLVDLAAGRPAVALLGDMHELGEGSDAYHRLVGEHCAAAGVAVVAVGALARAYLVGAPGERWFASVDDCLAALDEVVPPGAAVLVKASRAARLERLAEALLAARGEDGRA